MAISGIPASAATGEIERVPAQSRPVGPAATPALQSSSGLIGRPGTPPDATPRRQALPGRAPASAVPRSGDGASPSKVSLADLFRMDDEQERWMLERRGGGRFDNDQDKGLMSRAAADEAAAQAQPLGPAGHAASSTLPRAPAKRVRFAASAGLQGTPASGSGVASMASASAQQERAEKALRKEAVFTLNSAVGRLQALAIQDPERARQAIEKRVLPAEVMGESLGPEFTREVLDLHAMYEKVETKAAAGRRSLGVEETFGRAALGIAEVKQNVLNRAATMAEMGMAPPTPELRELNPDQLKKVSDALKGRGRALQRMNERALRASPKTLMDKMRRAVQHGPRALEGSRHRDFVALVDRDISALVAKLNIEPRHAAWLLQRAVHGGQMGADSLRPQDRALLLEVLAAKASKPDGR